MKIEDALLTKNPCYKTGRKIEVKGLMLHSVGCTQPHAMAFVRSWNSPDYERACVHGFIDAETGVVYQTLPWAHRGWHGASGPNGSVNNTHVGVEMCESGSLKYTHGATFECSNTEEAKTMAKRTFDAAVELFAYLCKKYRLDPLEDGVIISHKEGHDRGVASGHVDPEHLWTQLDMPLSMDVFRKAVKAKLDSGDVYQDDYPTHLQAKDLADLPEETIVEKVGPLFTADHRAYGVMAAVSMAQFILESAYGKSELAQNANNCFGMKKILSGNCWGGSAWDGESFYTKKTTEEYKVGEISIITADFRKYPCIEASIADHSAYLLGAKNGDKLRYEGIAELTDYHDVAQCIKDGGYATSSTYVEKLCRIIEKWDLTRFNFDPEGPERQQPRVLEA